MWVQPRGPGAFKILEGFRTLAGVAEQCGGVGDRHHVDAGPVEPLPVLFGDLEIPTRMRRVAAMRPRQTMIFGRMSAT